jgi:hypothetical protein
VLDVVERRDAGAAAKGPALIPLDQAGRRIEAKARLLEHHDSDQGERGSRAEQPEHAIIAAGGDEVVVDGGPKQQQRGADRQLRPSGAVVGEEQRAVRLMAHVHTTTAAMNLT